MLYKAIDELCGICEQQLKLIREMSALLIQADIPDETMDGIATQIAEIENDMDVSESHLRRFGR